EEAKRLGRRLDWRAVVDSFSEERAAELFARFYKNGTWHCPTLTMLRGRWAWSELPTLVEDDRMKYIPPAYRNDLIKKARADMPPGRAEFGTMIFEKYLELTGRMHRAGVNLMVGTDYQNPYCLPGFGVHDELQLLVRAGLTPMDALRAASAKPAEFLEKSD